MVEKKSHLYSFFFASVTFPHCDPVRHNYSCLSQECLLSVVLYMYVFVGFVGWCVCVIVCFLSTFSVCLLPALGMEIPKLSIQSRVFHPQGQKQRKRILTET